MPRVLLRRDPPDAGSACGFGRAEVQVVTWQLPCRGHPGAPSLLRGPLMAQPGAPRPCGRCSFTVTADNWCVCEIPITTRSTQHQRVRALSLPGFIDDVPRVPMWRIAIGASC